MADSMEITLWFKIPANTYSVKLNPSKAKYTPKKSYVDVNKNINNNEKPIIVGNSIAQLSLSFKTSLALIIHKKTKVSINRIILDTLVYQQLIKTNPNIITESLETLNGIKDITPSNPIKKKSHR